jgi:TolB protein
MCVALAAGILAAWLVVVLGTPTKRAEAAFPGNNGKIAFVSELNRGPEIVTMKPNGDNKTALTNNHVDDSNPDFSANGKKIAFEHNGDIVTMSANGTNKKQVTRSESPDFDPVWSPDGTKIAFARERHDNTDIYVINKDGTSLTRLTTSTKWDSDPAWSPDGTRIAFRRGAPTNYAHFKIYVMKVARESETNRPQRLTTSGPNVDEYDAPDWSPNGTRIAFASNQSGEAELYSIRADGSDLIQLTTTSITLVYDPVWSPDGTKIAFTGKPEKGLAREIFVMKAAPESETNRPKLLTNVSFNYFPDWQPLR